MGVPRYSLALSAGAALGPPPPSLPKDNEETGRVREGGETRVSEKGRKGGRSAWSE